MGLTIHYNGKFNQSSSLSAMIEELKDIAEIYKWKYHIYVKEFPENSLGKETHDNNIYGIIFIPPDCEPVYFTFLSNGKMSTEDNLKFWGNSKDTEKKKYLYMLSTKTQYAGREIHKFIIHLFQHISKKYFAEFSMYDEGKYWETNDEKLLDEIFSRFEDALDIVGIALENIPRNEDESFDKYFDRILKGLGAKRKK